MKNIAIFGTSWSDPFYDHDRMYTPDRNKTWTEFLCKYYDNFKLHTFARSGGSNDLSMTILTSLITEKNKNMKWDLIIYEISPLIRSFIPTDETFDWCKDTGFASYTLGDPREDRFMMMNRTNSLDNNHTVYNNTSIDAWHLAPTGVYHVSQEQDCRRCEENTILNDDRMGDILSNLSLASVDFNVNRTLCTLAAIPNISKTLGTKIVTITMDDPRWYEWGIYTKTVSGGQYPSNIGLFDILIEYSKTYPRTINENINEEWWIDWAHPTGKGWEWILDNIMMKNEKFKEALDSVLNV